MKQTIIQVQTLTCPSCVRRIELAVSKLVGVRQVDVKFNASKVVVLYEEENQTSTNIVETIEKMGYPCLSVQE